jgi:hypothetical protein
MERGQRITVTLYDEKYDKTGETTVYVSEIGRSINDDQMAELLEDYINHFKEYRHGLRIGKELENAHRTLQASLFRWALGLCVGLSERTVTRLDGTTFDDTDARNEMSVRCGRDIKRLIEEGVLKMGYMI